MIATAWKGPIYVRDTSEFYEDLDELKSEWDERSIDEFRIFRCRNADFPGGTLWVPTIEIESS